MSVVVTTYWSTLIRKAHAVGQARKDGDPVALRKALDDLESYEQAVRNSDRMILDNVQAGDL